jgi:hypothetical protein
MPLTKHDAEQLLEQLYATAEVLGSEIKPAAASLMVRDLRQHERSEIEQALARCRSELTGRLTLAAILDRMPSANAYLSPNEAWALALTSLDDRDTVVWTQEVASAMGVAQPVLDQGDKVGARMAFLAAYDREVATAKAEGREPKWQVSLGYDPAGRKAAIEEAVRAGRLPAPKVEHLLPAPELTGDDEVGEITAEEKARRTAAVNKLRALLDDANIGGKAGGNDWQEERREELLRQAGVNHA